MENDMPQSAITDRSPHSPPYKRHRPEQTLLYQIIEAHYPEFREVMAMHDCMDAGGRARHGAVAEGKALLPLHVQQEFADYLKCGRLEHGFLRVQCSECHHEHLVAFSCTKSRRFRRSSRLLPELWRKTHG